MSLFTVYLVSPAGAAYQCPDDTELLRFVARDTNPVLLGGDLCVVYVDPARDQPFGSTGPGGVAPRRDRYTLRSHIMFHLKREVNQSFDWAHRAPVRKLEAHKVTDKYVDLHPSASGSDAASAVLDELKARGFARVPQYDTVRGWAMHRLAAIGKLDEIDEIDES